MHRPITLALALTLLFIAGCENNGAYMTKTRKSNGLVVILPGIEGESPANRNVRQGLDNAGIFRGLPIWHWGRPVPGAGMVLNQVDFIGNRIAGQQVADRIMKYLQENPGRPVHIVGHSGGGGVAVFAAERLKEGYEVEGLVLLSASISSEYDLSKAMQRCNQGIVNFYNRGDGAMLAIGTTVMGNVDGRHGPSAGLIGFSKPKATDSPAKKAAYSKLFEVRVTPAMTGNSLAHFSTTRPLFVTQYIAPWIRSTEWPADVDVLTYDPENKKLTISR